MARHIDIQKRASALNRKLVKTASWWGTDPMAGDTSLDLLAQVGRLDPRKAGNLIEKWLKSREVSQRYAAMGVWDVVMSSGVAPYVQVFDYLGPDVAMAARKGIPRDDDWYEEPGVEMWLRLYARGKPTGKLRKHKFIPKGLKGVPIWYILNAEASSEWGIELTVELVNTYTGERKTEKESFEAPGDNYVEDVSAANYGGQKSRQQAILIEVTDEEGQSYDRQVEIDPETGDFSDLGDWGEA